MGGGGRATSCVAEERAARVVHGGLAGVAGTSNNNPSPCISVAVCSFVDVAFLGSLGCSGSALSMVLYAPSSRSATPDGVGCSWLFLPSVNGNPNSTSLGGECRERTCEDSWSQVCLLDSVGIVVSYARGPCYRRP